MSRSNRLRSLSSSECSHSLRRYRRTSAENGEQKPVPVVPDDWERDRRRNTLHGKRSVGQVD